MFRSKTVIVVGAGASHELGLPLGEELKDHIRALLQFDRQGHQKGGDGTFARALAHAAKEAGLQFADVANAGMSVSRALQLTSSIDEYLHAMAHDPAKVIAGKVAIVRAILTAERNSSLPTDDRYRANDQQNFPESWLVPFFRQLVGGVVRTKLTDLFENVAFVIFNYDRCVETFLYRALQLRYDIDAAEATGLLHKATFLHPYGTVGRLPWQQGSGRQIGFGDEPDSAHLAESSKSIRLFSEDRPPEVGSDSIGQAIGTAKRLVFLGFSYQKQNMELLAMPKDGGPPEAVFGTAYGISSDDQAKVNDSIHAVLRVRAYVKLVRFHEGTCSTLFSQYSRSIAE